MSDTLCLLSTGSEVLLWRNSLATISSFGGEEFQMRFSRQAHPLPPFPVRGMQGRTIVGNGRAWAWLDAAACKEVACNAALRSTVDNKTHYFLRLRPDHRHVSSIRLRIITACGRHEVRCCRPRHNRLPAGYAAVSRSLRRSLALRDSGGLDKPR